jgi:hypothetical protein
MDGQALTEIKRAVRKRHRGKLRRINKEKYRIYSEWNIRLKVTLISALTYNLQPNTVNIRKQDKSGNE